MGQVFPRSRLLNPTSYRPFNFALKPRASLRGITLTDQWLAPSIIMAVALPIVIWIGTVLTRALVTHPPGPPDVLVVSLIIAGCAVYTILFPFLLLRRRTCTVHNGQIHLHYRGLFISRRASFPLSVARLALTSARYRPHVPHSAPHIVHTTALVLVVPGDFLILSRWVDPDRLAPTVPIYEQLFATRAQHLRGPNELEREIESLTA